MRQIEASHHLGDHERELEQIEELERRYPDERSIFFYKVRALAALGYVESLRAAFAAEDVTRYPPEVVAVRYRNTAIDLYAHGHHEAAREFARLGVDWIDGRTTAANRPSAFDAGFSLRARQQLLYQKGRLLEVLGERQEALVIYADLYEQTPDAWFLRAHMGVVHASLGHISEAMQTDRWLQALDAPYQSGDVTSWRAGIAARLGDLQQAVALLEQSRQEGMSWTELHALFHLDESMGDYEGFRASMSPTG
jgi:tetratricopeptide (TPR) repeat protein